MAYHPYLIIFEYSIPLSKNISFAVSISNLLNFHEHFKSLLYDIFFGGGLKFDNRFEPKRSKKSNPNILIVIKSSRFDLGFAVRNSDVSIYISYKGTTVMSKLQIKSGL